jgi:hypothetical protein
VLRSGNNRGASATIIFEARAAPAKAAESFLDYPLRREYRQPVNRLEAGAPAPF